MDTKSFAEYVVNNITRATLANALNISNKLSVNGDGVNVYNIFEFFNYMIEYLKSLNNFDVMKLYRIIIASNDCETQLKSEVKYNETMVIDDFIISLWEICNGYKTA